MAEYISTYDADLKYVYIDYFDKSFTKLWSREFKYNSNKEYSISPMNYNNDTMAFVIDNDLYIADLKKSRKVRFVKGEMAIIFWQIISTTKQGIGDYYIFLAYFFVLVYNNNEMFFRPSGLYFLIKSILSYIIK